MQPELRHQSTESEVLQKAPRGNNQPCAAEPKSGRKLAVDKNELTREAVETIEDMSHDTILDWLDRFGLLEDVHGRSYLQAKVTLANHAAKYWQAAREIVED